MTTLGILVGVPLLTGFAQWWEILAILIGLGLIALEIFVIPGFGVTGISGIILVLGGLTLTWAGSEPHGFPGALPSLPGTRQAIERGLTIVVVGLGCSLFLWIWLQRYLPKLPYVNKLILTATTANITATPSNVPGAVNVTVWPEVGAIGQVVTDLKPGGTASFHDPALNDVRITDVLADSGFVRAGSRVIVRESAGSASWFAPRNQVHSFGRSNDATYSAHALAGRRRHRAARWRAAVADARAAGDCRACVVLRRDRGLFLHQPLAGRGGVSCGGACKPVDLDADGSRLGPLAGGQADCPVADCLPAAAVMLRLGDLGTTVTELRPMGEGEFGGQRFEVVSEHGIFPPARK